MNIYAKDITKSNVVDLVDMRKKYNLKGSDLSAQIGCDHAIYIIFEDWTHRPILTESRIIRFELDWSSGPKTKNIE
ncbi:MAG: hypothetical protein FWH48_06930, partial [Oscillospiraceae bacterium]|nr:hypothetical protein [Oscillospiraceae bacterium]